MRTRGRARALAVTAPTLAIAGLMALAGAATWAVAMIQRALLVAEYGPICTVHGASPFSHCPACYVGAGLVAAAAGLALAGVRRAAD